jgi:hypothetical protein
MCPDVGGGEGVVGTRMERAMMRCLVNRADEVVARAGTTVL